jgi:hypothetical protein
MQKLIIFMLAALLITNAALAQKKETRNVSSFSELSFGVPGKLYLKQGSTEKVELEGDADILEKIETEVSGGKLSIRLRDQWKKWNWNNHHITAYVTMKNIDGIAVSGSGDIMGEGVFNTNDLALKVSGSGNLTAQANASGVMDIAISGSGNLDIKGKCKSLDSKMSGSGNLSMKLDMQGDSSFKMSGSGKINASGSSDKTSISISGSGTLRGADFATKICKVRISGSGDVEISVKDELETDISGSGSVSYRGDPGKLNSHSAGSGKVRKM